MTDALGNFESFQEEVVKGKVGVKNVSQYIKKFEPMDGLKRMIDESCEIFEKKWKDRYCKNVSQKTK